MPVSSGIALGTRILGIDPGLNITGYAVIEATGAGPAVCEAGVLRNQREGLAGRLRQLYDGLIEVLEQYTPAVMVVEQVYAHYAHPRTAILMAHARGVILLAAARRGIPVVSYNATRIKKTIAGSGRASKDQVQRTIQQELGLPAVPEPPDVADALAAALCHYYVQKLAQEPTTDRANGRRGGEETSSPGDREDEPRRGRGLSA
jgi:crossover junction endodeoxyribonuclease RuvC